MFLRVAFIARIILYNWADMRWIEAISLDGF